MNRDSHWMNLETLLFFETHPEALPLYEAFESTLYALFPDIGKRVQKTQITFYKRYVFACASFARVKRKADLPDPPCDNAWPSVFSYLGPGRCEVRTVSRPMDNPFCHRQPGRDR